MNGRAMDIKQSLTEHLQKFQSAPFLFMGSGVSRRYLKTEGWEAMLRRFATEAGLDAGYYISKADANLPAAASLLAKDFHSCWWKDAKYQESRRLHESEVQRYSSPLKIEISGYLKTFSLDNSNSALNEEIAAFREATIDGIISTNWDLLLENIFPDYEIYVGQQQLLFSQPQSIAEIYKIHGCCTRPESLVLTAEDYAEFDQRNPYLAAKLLAVFIEHPVIFMGYSLADPNVYSILRAITACLDSENLQRLQRHMVFVEWDPCTEPQMASSVLSIDGRPLPVTLVKTTSFLGIFEALGQLRRCFPAKLLRRLKKHVYELVRSNDPEEQMHVLDIEEDTEDSKIQIVYGVGVGSELSENVESNQTPGVVTPLGELGYRRIKIEQVMRDVVYDDGDLDADKMVRFTLPDLLVNQRYTPVFKYMRGAGYVGPNAKDGAGLDPKLRKSLKMSDSAFDPSRSYVSDKKRDEIARKIYGLAGLQKNYDTEHCAVYIPLLEKDAITPSEIQKFLQAHYDALFTTNRVALKKLIALYDLRRYGPGADGHRH